MAKILSTTASPVMPNDDQLILQPVATNLVGAGTTNNTALQRLDSDANILSPQVVVFVSALVTGAGETYTFALEQADDSGFTTNNETIGSKILSDASATKEAVVFDTDSITRSYVRLNVTLVGVASDITSGSYLAARY